MSEQEPNQCDRCEKDGDELTWWRTVITVSGKHAHVCEDCRHQIGGIDVDPSDWPINEAADTRPANFKPASEGWSG